MATEQELLLGLEIVTEGAGLAVPETLARPAFATESFQRQAAAHQKKAKPWTQGAGIQGVGIGAKITKGTETQDLALRVYVESKKAKSKVRNPVPSTVKVPDVGKLPTDVIAIGKVEAEVFPDRVRPAMPGSSIAHVKVTAGTFGCLVRERGFRRGKKGVSRSLFVLSNSHVLANSGVAAVGDDIVQPGPLDGGRRPRDVIGTLEDWVPFIFTSTGFPNKVDAAIARVRKSSVRPEVRILGVRPAGVSFGIRRGARVMKVGRTTDFTTGVVQDVHYRLSLNYKKPGGGTGRAGLRDQVLCTRYTAGGDSGSAVLNSRRRLVGLHFAGSPSTSIFNKIGNVFRLLNVELARD